MLPLDHPRWSELRHAYGAADDVPERLRALAAAPGPAGEIEQEPWYGLWSALCHQGNVFSASYAAIPHIVRIAIKSPGPVDLSFFALPAAVEVARISGRGEAIPDDLGEAYRTALVDLAEAVARHRFEPWDRPKLLAAAAALAVAKGDFEVAEALLNLDDDWIDKIARDESD
jgi:hypothetical protein